MIFRVEKTRDYTVLGNFHFRDKTLSLKAKGLLSLMLSLPEDWDYSVAGLVSLSTDGETSVRSAIKELETHGYLKRERVYENGKIVDWNYIVFEQPQLLSDEDLVVENQQVGFQLVGFQGQLNTNKSNTKKSNTDTLSKDNVSTERASADFEFGVVPETKKPNLYQKCIALIDEFTNIPSIRTPLIQYLDLCMEMKSIRGANQWKGMLNTLERVQRECHPHTFEEIIQMSIDHGWKTFYPIKDMGYKKPKSVKNDIEKISANDYANYNQALSEREF